MQSRPVISAAALALLCGVLATSQTVANAKNENAGVNPIRLLDQKEVRVSRVEIQPGAVRSVHTHDDVRFHLWIPISGKLEVTIGSAKPVEAASGQAFFLERGTPHGFKNVGSTPAAVIEVFVKDAPSAAEVQSLGVALAALAKLP